MLFNHIKHPEVVRPFVKMLDRKDGHYYETENGEVYPSITTILKTFTKDGIQKWREAVGYIEADRITKESQDVGNTLHEIISSHLNGHNIAFTGDMPFPPEILFECLEPYINSIDNIHAVELPLMSTKMKVAGTVDCIGEYDGELCVIDFKNSRKKKTHSRILNYFLQATAYSIMAKECLDLDIKTGIIMIGVWDDGKGEPTSQIYKFKVEDYVGTLWEKLVEYEKSLIY